MIREFEQKRNGELKNILAALMPKSLVEVVLIQSGVSGKTAANSVSREQRQRLVYTIKNLKFTITGMEKINAGIVTAGGVDCKQIDPKTMMSKLVKNLYFIGEVLDIDALTGGFNLQLAFCTANQMCRSVSK